MASNVELEVESKPEIIDDKSIDIHTQRPRTPNIPYSFYTEEQIDNIKQNNTSFFMVQDKVGELDYNKHRRRKWDDSKKKTGDNTCDGEEEGEGDTVDEHTAWRAGAYIPWGTKPAPGDKTCRHFKEESRDDFAAIELYRRPATNRPAPIIFKYGRPNTDYYAPRYPSAPADLTKDDDGKGKGKSDQDDDSTAQLTCDGYVNKRKLEQKGVRQKMRAYPEISEYIDKYTLLTRSMPGVKTLEQKKAFAASGQ